MLPTPPPGPICEYSGVLLSPVGAKAPTGVGEFPRLFQLALCRERLAVFIEWCCSFPELAWVEDGFFDFFFEWLLDELFDFFVLLGAAPPVSGAIVGELLVWA
jgi:hypothetical protein